MEKLDYWSLVNFLLLKQNTLTYSCSTDTKLHVHVVNFKLPSASYSQKSFTILVQDVEKANAQLTGESQLLVTQVTALENNFGELRTKFEAEKSDLETQISVAEAGLEKMKAEMEVILREKSGLESNLLEVVINYSLKITLNC